MLAKNNTIVAGKFDICREIKPNLLREEPAQRDEVTKRLSSCTAGQSGSSLTAQHPAQQSVASRPVLCP